MPEPLTFIAAPADPRDRLDKLVVELLARAGHPTTRGTIQRWIDHARVLVDGAVAKPSTKISPGARIDISPEPPEPTTATPDASVAFHIVHEDDHLLVIDKPAGLVVHPARGHAGGTLVNGLLARADFTRAPADPRDPLGYLRPGIVHRLDKGTSGLLVVARDEPTREALKAQFAAHTIEREYLAIVEGTPREGVIDTLHARHPSDRLRFTSRTPTGRRAVTHVRVIEALAEATLVACRLETGRTHQIRVHLSERAGTPILGDPLYARPPKSPALRAAADALGHQALHARLLGFIHPTTGKAVRWESPLPNDLERLLEALRTASRRR